MLLVKKFCSITLDLRSHTRKARTLFKSAWSRSDGFFNDLWSDDEIKKSDRSRGEFYFLPPFLVGVDWPGFIVTDKGHSTHWTPSVCENLVLPRGWQGSTTLLSDNQSAPPSTPYTSPHDWQRGRERPECHRGWFCNHNAVKEVVKPREASSFDFQIIQRPHTHRFLFPPLWKTPPNWLPKKVKLNSI